MTVPDAIVALAVAALPGASLWDDADGTPSIDALLVFDGAVPPTPPRRYVVVYPDIGNRSASAVCDQSDDVMFRWQATSVAPDRQMAAWLAKKMQDGFVDARPTVAGYGFGLIRHTYSQPPQRDEAILERPVVYQVDQYSLLATKL